MKKIFLFSILLLSIFCKAQLPTAIIPQPVNIQVNAGFFTIDTKTSIYLNNSKELITTAHFLTNAIKNVAGFDLAITPALLKLIPEPVFYMAYNLCFKHCQQSEPTKCCRCLV